MNKFCILRKGLFDRWYIFNPLMPWAWSGSRWVAATEEGLPTGGVQICNFASEEEAREYCREHRLESK